MKKNCLLSFAVFVYGILHAHLAAKNAGYPEINEISRAITYDKHSRYAAPFPELFNKRLSIDHLKKSRTQKILAFGFTGASFTIFLITLNRDVGNLFTDVRSPTEFYVLSSVLLGIGIY